MNCEEFKREFKSWLNDQWEVDDEVKIPGHLKEHASECSRCSVRLEGALLLVDGKRFHKEPPEGLSQRIAEHLTGNSAPHVINWQRWVSIPAAAVLVVALSFFMTQRFIQLTPSDTVIVHLVFEAPGVSEVAVVGDWNGWDPVTNRLSDEDGDGTWEIEFSLKRGEEYQYQFLIDGERWVADPLAPLQVKDGFDGFNSILEI